MKKILSLLLIFILCLSFTSPTSSQAATKARINKSKASMLTGESLQLKINGSKSKVKWSSSDKSVAIVSQNGKVSAKYVGDVIITATISKKKYTCKITVQALNKNITLYEDDYLKLTYMNTLNNGVYFNVFNKTSDSIHLYADYLILDGQTYPSDPFSKNIAPNLTEIYCYIFDMGSNNPKTLSGKFVVYDSQGYNIEEVKIENIDIK